MMDVLLSDIKSVGLILLSVVALLVLSIGAYFLLKLIKYVFGKMGIQISDAQMDSVKKVVTDIVKYLNQKIVNGLKAANPDGKLTDDQAKEIHDKAISLITTSLTEDQKKVLTEKFGDVDTALDIMTEAAVGDNHVSSDEIQALIETSVKTE